MVSLFIYWTIYTTYNTDIEGRVNAHSISTLQRSKQELQFSKLNRIDFAYKERIHRV